MKVAFLIERYEKMSGRNSARIVIWIKMYQRMSLQIDDDDHLT